MTGDGKSLQTQGIGQHGNISGPIEDAPTRLKGRVAIARPVDCNQVDSQLAGDLVMKMKIAGAGHAVKEKKRFAMQIASFGIGEGTPV